MKIRNGFVSNSSSSSFVITGKHYDKSMFDEMIMKVLPETEHQEYEDDPRWFLEKYEKFSKLEFVIDEEAGSVWAGEAPVASEEARRRIANSLSIFDPTVERKNIHVHCEELYC